MESAGMSVETPSEAQIKEYLEAIKEAREQLKKVMSGTEKAKYITERLIAGHFKVVSQEDDKFWVDIELEAEKVSELRIYHQSFSRTRPLPSLFSRLHKPKGGQPLVRCRLDSVFNYFVSEFLSSELQKKVKEIYEQLLAQQTTAESG